MASVRAYPGPSGHEPGSEEIELSESDELANAHGDEEDCVLLFVGGPLDGRVQFRSARHGEPLPTITHVYLHGGPKVVHRYDLEQVTEQGGVYHLRASSHHPARDEQKDPPAPHSSQARGGPLQEGQHRS